MIKVMSRKNIVPLLTIAIPTFNRSDFLRTNLAQLNNQTKSCSRDTVELLVSDNASEDATEYIVKSAQKSGMIINYVKNANNIGSDANIAQCFNMARGRYVLILGDDDLLMDGLLALLLKHLEGQRYGVVFLKPYGYNHDFRKENPGGGGYKIYNSSEKFIEQLAHLITLISACVINKDLLKGVDAMKFCGSNLVQVDLALSASLKAKENLFISSYSVACKRNNSGGYDFEKVFVTNFFSILDSYQAVGLSKNTIGKIENRLIVSFFPQYLFKQRREDGKVSKSIFKTFDNRFGNKLLFKIYLVPILLWPRFAALIWGAIVTLIGRVYAGDIRRGVFFVIDKIRYKS